MTVRPVSTGRFLSDGFRFLLHFQQNEEAVVQEIELREKGTDKVHKYDAWAWESEAPDDNPDWMPGEITEANVSKKGIDHLEEE